MKNENSNFLCFQYRSCKNAADIFQGILKNVWSLRDTQETNKIRYNQLKVVTKLEVKIKSQWIVLSFLTGLVNKCISRPFHLGIRLFIQSSALLFFRIIHATIHPNNNAKLLSAKHTYIYCTYILHRQHVSTHHKIIFRPLHTNTDPKVIV
jgi:hypothetical protein